MENKYKAIGLDYDLIHDKYPNINEYEEIVNTYLSDPFFNDLKGYIDNEDYALVKDAAKGLFLLAQELYIYPLYLALVEIYEDVEDETTVELPKHYKEMMEVYKKIKGAFLC